MGQIYTGDEGFAQIVVGNALFTLDSVHTTYPSAHEREYRLSNAGYSIHRTEAIDKGGKISKRGIDTTLFFLWIRKGKITAERRGRKPGRR